MKIILNLITHTLTLVVGFVMGVYLLPIMTAPDSPLPTAMNSEAGDYVYYGTFVRELEDSDFLHWGDGEVSISQSHVVFEGRLAPGPDYRLYFSPEYLETEADFEKLKASMQDAGGVRTFENFIVRMPPDLDIERYNTIIVWCEAFGQFITAAKYR